MKKNRLFSLMLAAMLALQAAFVPVYAAPEEDGASASIETTVPPDSTETSGTQTPAESTEYVIPDNITGDASVTMGSKTLDAQRPLADAEDYTVKAKAALLYELNSDTLILAQDADVQLYPASLTKVMTCMLTIELANLEDTVTVSSTALKDLSPGGSGVGLKVGEQMTVRDMLYCLMVSSANDGACALAEHVAGDIDSFVELMNQKAAELGCTGTHFANPHGLHDENHYTTARDLAKIFKAALEYPLFNEIYSTDLYTVPATNLSEPRELKTTNYLIRNAGYPVVLDSRVVGGKTGFTTPAGRCLMTVSEDGGMKLMTVILGTTAVYGEDGYSVIRYGNFEETSNLLDFGYDTYTTALVLTPDQVAGQFTVTNGAHNAFGMVEEAMYAVVPRDSDYNTIKYEYDLVGDSLSAPVQENQEIGVIRVWYEDKCLAQQTLLSASDVAVQTKSSAANNASRAPEQESGLWHIVLIVALVVLVLIAVFLVLVRIRAAARRARRRRRKNAARSASGASSRSGERPRRRR